MKFLLAILLTAALAFLGGMFLPWWSIAIASFAVALLVQQPIGRGFLAGFLGIFLLWGILALLFDIPNQHILSGQIAHLLPLGGSSILLVFITALMGGVVGGFAGLTGSSAVARKTRKRY
jgi:hypothetical protein